MDICVPTTMILRIFKYVSKYNTIFNTNIFFFYTSPILKWTSVFIKKKIHLELMIFPNPYFSLYMYINTFFVFYEIVCAKLFFPNT